ncbi:MAG: hypothetical protein AB1Z98_08675 [Nannocystaceae bacterium]
MPPSQDVTGWITGLGAVTSVGLDAATTCASIRAGIVRPCELEGHQSLSYLDYEPTPTIGHVVPELSRGFVSVGRWLQLAAPAIEDLCTTESLPRPADDRRFWGATIAYLLVPEPSVRFMVDPLYGETQLPGSFRDPLLQRTASVFAPRRVGILDQGRHGTLELLNSIHWPLEGVERIIVVATDALTDAPALDWLSRCRRLKNDMNPVGLSPSEASVALMIEDPRAAARRGAQGHAVLHAVATDVDPERSSGEGVAGIGLARAVSEVLERTSLHRHGTSSQVADLNGEVWRAKERAAAQQRVGFDRWNDEHLVIPAVSTGDPGAAMPALQLTVAAVALRRGYARGSSVLVTSSDRLGRVGAAIVGRA